MNITTIQLSSINTQVVFGKEMESSIVPAEIIHQQAGLCEDYHLFSLLDADALILFHGSKQEIVKSKADALERIENLIQEDYFLQVN
mgnify:CR=1 FL=1